MGAGCPMTTSCNPSERARLRLMNQSIDTQRLRSFRLFLAGMFVLILLWILPHGGQETGRTFLDVAFDSSWRVFGEWPAAWCSVQLMLLSVGALCWIVSGWLLASALTSRESLEWIVLALALGPLCCLWVGGYCLARAVL